ncbi:N-acetylmuramoyl-L-alanine amidase [Paenibacillus tianmuensis]|uniref:N-acetylmuramoyl-L-alanine amidase n=1 Tax=Paenibacillus tianmuensis TaxID=624147 RepID=A0A1G4RJV6_9BACL|nr:peptidoglycan recognition family protein [Paenibacillus tianmuensis]SCW57100.1 N-acetylmuramoyl-L-alanine amidase [Paenibacillus tianmuensis]
MNGFKMKFPITTRYLTGPSKRRPCIPMPGVRFMVAHDTGNPGSTAAGNVSYYERSRNDMSASAHLFVDDRGIIECIPFLTGTPEKAYHVVYNVTTDSKMYGCNSNDAAGGVELCYGGRINLQEAYKRYIWVLAYACYRYGLNPATDITGHHILDPARRTDPVNALRLLGKKFEQFIADVVTEYQECTNEEDEPILEAGLANTIIDTWMGPAWKEVDAKRREADRAGNGTAAGAHQKQADYIHWLANELRKASGQVLQ